MATKYTKWPQNIPNGHKMYQMATKYTKSPQNIPNGRKIDRPNSHKIYRHRTKQDPRKFTQFGIFCLKIWQPWTASGGSGLI
jgi:hypothetical protein